MKSNLRQFGSLNSKIEIKVREILELRFAEIPDTFDFTVCQRPNGTYYGIAPGKQCRKGRQVNRAAVLGALAKRGVPRKALGKIARIKDDKEFGKAVQELNAGRKPLRNPTRLAPAIRPAGPAPQSQNKTPTVSKQRAEKLAKIKELRQKILEKRGGRDFDRFPKEWEPLKKVSIPAPESKNQKPLYKNGKDVDLRALETKASKWRKLAGLTADPGTNDWKHDRVHVLVHDFLGGYGKIGEWIGVGPKTPTPAEEVLVNMIHRAAAIKGKGQDPRATLTDDEVRRYVARDIAFMSKRGDIGFRADKAPYFMPGTAGGSVKEGDIPDTGKFLKKFREMEASEDYDNLLDASYAAFTSAGDLLL